MLKIKNLESGYGKIKIQIKMLKGIDLSVKTGQIVALLGGNETGKSTLLKTISRLIESPKGEINFNGDRIDRYRPDKIVHCGLTQVT